MTRSSALLAAAVAIGGWLGVAPVPALAGHWECRDGIWTAVGGPSHPRPLRACAERPPSPKTEAECRRAKGRWGRAGLFPGAICVVPTADAGRVCGDGGECESLCLAEPTSAEQERLKAGEPIAATGRCARARPVFGCMYRVVKGQIRQRICAD